MGVSWRSSRERLLHRGHISFRHSSIFMWAGSVCSVTWRGRTQVFFHLSPFSGGNQSSSLPPAVICSPVSVFPWHFSQDGSKGRSGGMLIKSNWSPCTKGCLVTIQLSCLLVQTPCKYSPPALALWVQQSLAGVLILAIPLVLGNHIKYFRQFGYYVKCMWSTNKFSWIDE